MAALAQFTCFMKLPPEMRINIWEYCILPRIVNIWPSKAIRKKLKHSTFNRPEGGNLDDEASVMSPQPAVLSACYESRMQGLKVYRMYFEPQLGRGYYLNLSMDILCPTPTKFRRPQPLSGLWSTLHYGYSDEKTRLITRSGAAPCNVPELTLYIKTAPDFDKNAFWSEDDHKTVAHHRMTCSHAVAMFDFLLACFDGHVEKLNLVVQEHKCPYALAHFLSRCSMGESRRYTNNQNSAQGREVLPTAVTVVNRSDYVQREGCGFAPDQFGLSSK